MSALLGVKVAARFLLELAALAALAVAGWSLGTSTPGRVLLAVVLPLAAGVLWGSFVAPKARRRLPDPSRLGVEPAVLVVANEVLLFVWDQRAF